MSTTTITRRRAVKYRMYPTKEQANLIDRTIGCARLVYNLMLETRIASYQSRFGMPDAQAKEPLPTPRLYKDDYPFLRDVDSMALCNAQMHLDKAYRSFFTNPKTGFPKYKSKHRSRQTYTTNCIRNNIRFENGGTRLRLPKVGPVRVRQHKRIPDDWKLKSVTVEHCPSGRYEATVLFEYDTQAPEPVRPRTFVGLDYSSHDLYVTSDGERADYPRFYRQWQERLAFEQRKLSHMVTGSANWAKQKRRVAKVHERIRDMRRDLLRKAANRITESHDCVCVEDLDMRAMARTLTLGKSTMDNGFGMLRDMLDRKLAEQGKPGLVKVGRWYPSSQLCSDCGYRYEGTKDLGVREWVCPECGAWHDRDVNAAKNIRDEGRRLLLQQ